jgi:hypothetical protein
MNTGTATAGGTQHTPTGDSEVRALLTGVSIFLLVGAVLAVATLAGAMVFIRTKFVHIFEDFDTDLPVLTELLVAIPNIVVIVLAMLAIGALIAKEVYVRKPVTNLVINLVTALAVSAGFAVMVLALWLPLVKLIQSVEG